MLFDNKFMNLDKCEELKDAMNENILFEFQKVLIYFFMTLLCFSVLNLTFKGRDFQMLIMV